MTGELARGRVALVRLGDERGDARVFPAQRGAVPGRGHGQPVAQRDLLRDALLAQVLGVLPVQPVLHLHVVLFDLADLDRLRALDAREQLLQHLLVRAADLVERGAHAVAEAAEELVEPVHLLHAHLPRNRGGSTAQE